jgi:hypothetical protein
MENETGKIVCDLFTFSVKEALVVSAAGQITLMHLQFCFQFVKFLLGRSYHGEGGV